MSKKFITLILKNIISIILYIICFPVFFFIICIKPFFHFRFGKINTIRYGTFCSQIFFFLDQIKKEENNSKKIDLLGRDTIISNSQLYKMAIRANLNIVPFSTLTEFLRKGLRFWTRSKSFDSPMVNALQKSFWKKNEENNIQIKFTEKEKIKGQNLIKKLGIPKNSEWICIFNRDENYLNSLIKNKDWSYHSYRDFEPESLIEASNQFIKENLYVVRLGSKTKKKLSSKNKKIIDYPNTGLSDDFLDVFLAANCKLYFGGDSGVNDIPLFFNKPVYLINCSLTLLKIYSEKFGKIFITKHLYSNKMKKYLSLREIFQSGLNGCSETHKFLDKDIKVVSNSSSENLEFAKEVLDDINGKRLLTDEDIYLQKKFWSICKEFMPEVDFSNSNLNIGSNFLKKNFYLLD